MRVLKTSSVLLALMTVLFGMIYPLFMWGIGQIFFRKEANGSLLVNNQSRVIGSELIGQNFSKGLYFHPRPSAAGDKGYDASNSSGSNLGPTSKKLVDLLNERAMAYRAENGLESKTPLPADAVTASGSGLDPHISMANALLQANRIAKARNLSKEEVVKMIVENEEKPDFGIFGEKRVNVLRLNLALDRKGSHE